MDEILKLNQEINDLQYLLDSKQEYLKQLLDDKAKKEARFNIGDKIQSNYGIIEIVKIEGYLYKFENEIKFNIAYAGPKITKKGKKDLRCFNLDTIFESEHVRKTDV